VKNDYVPLSDPYILLSWLNMKLRDECRDLKELCERYNLSEVVIKDKIKAIDYVYKKSTNQFITSITEE